VTAAPATALPSRAGVLEGIVVRGLVRRRGRGQLEPAEIEIRERGRRGVRLGWSLHGHADPG
jgi:hypothetical protein